MNIYSCYNELSKSFEFVHAVKSDELASVALAVHCNQISPLEEWALYKVGSYDEDTGQITPCNPIEKLQFDQRRIKKLDNPS